MSQHMTMRVSRLLLLASLVVSGLRCAKDATAVAPPEADFTYQVTDPGKPPARVAFTDLSRNADTRFWFFFPGSNSAQADPVVDFRASGTFRVRLTVSNAGGEDTISREVVIPSLRYLAKFSTSILPADITLPIDVRIVDESIGTAINYFWDFGNGTTSINVNPVATYTAYGDYTIRQVVNFPEGPDSSRVILRIRP